MEELSPEERRHKKKVAYNNKWIAETLDRVNLTLPKGRKQELAEHAAARGESLNRFIVRAIDSQLETDNKKAGV